MKNVKRNMMNMFRATAKFVTGMSAVAVFTLAPTYAPTVVEWAKQPSCNSASECERKTLPEMLKQRAQQVTGIVQVQAITMR